MFVYLIVCLLLTLITLEHYVLAGSHPKAQRLLPLVLGLICVYNFYDIVEYMTKDFAVFGVLKYLLFVEMMYLLVYYILDFMQVSLPFIINALFFAFILVNNILICLNMYNQDQYGSKVLIFIIIFVVLLIITGTAMVIRIKHARKLYMQYVHLYVGMLVPLLAVIFTYVYGISDIYLLPGALAFFCIIINYLMSSSSFEDTPRFIREDLFNQLDRYITIFDADMEIIDATTITREQFPEYVEALEQHKNDNFYKNELISWVEQGLTEKVLQKEKDYFRCSIKPVYRRKSILGYIVTVVDITQEMENVETAQKALKDKSEYLASMSHELRSPLHAIIGAIDIMLATNTISSRNRALAKQVKVAGYNLLGIVNSILDYSKIENKMMELYEEKYDLKILIEEQLANSFILMNEKPVELSLDVETELPKSLIGDKNRVRSIFQNLISNSIKFTIEGYIKCRLSCEKISEKRVIIHFSVEDTGIGICKEDQEKIFSRYVSYNLKNETESTGIGLSLIRRLIEMMDGSINVESDGHSGTRFDVCFEQSIDEEVYYKPFSVNRNSLYIHRDIFEEKVSPNYIYPSAQVLIVDDIGVNRDILEIKISPWAMIITKAKSGEEAIELAKQKHFDFVFMDQMMPGMDGMATAKTILELYDVPIILISANTSDKMREAVERSGLAGYIAKPFTLQNLKDAIEKNIRVKQEPYISLEIPAPLVSYSPQDKAYRYSLQSYIETMEELIEKFPSMYEDDIEQFKVKVHGIKGTCRQLGRLQIAMYSEICEMAIESGHMEYLRTFIPYYLMEIRYDISDAEKELEIIQ